MWDVIVIGAGQAGLAAGYHLKQAGIGFVILEAGKEPTGSWPSYYQSLRLFSPAGYSALPGFPFPAASNHYPTRDEVAAYLKAYAAHFQLPIMAETRVEGVQKQDELFEVFTEDGRLLQSRFVIAATGSFSRPKMPTLAGQDSFAGDIIHSSAYQSPDEYMGKRVIVVGGGNSAVQIAVELAHMADVTLASRHPIRFMRQRLLGQDIHFWFGVTGFDQRSSSPFSSEPRVLDMGRYQQAVLTGRPNVRPMFRRFTESGVAWSDGQQETVDRVIFATGFMPNLSYLAGTGALNEAGHALQLSGISTSVPGLAYMGLTDMRSFSSATLRGVGRDASYVVQHAAQYLGIKEQAQRRFCCWPPLLSNG